MIDGHCHILPFLDDGSNSIEETENILLNLHKYDINSIVFTPHINTTYSDAESCKQVYDKCKPMFKQHNISTKLAYEVNWIMLAEIGLLNAYKYAIENTNFLLIELATRTLPINWENIITKLQKIGMKIIIAHPERCIPLYKDFSITKKLKKMGCCFMLSANFINPKLLSGLSLKSAKKMLKHGYVNAISSDAHCLMDYNDLKKAYGIASKYKFTVKDNDHFFKDIVFA